MSPQELDSRRRGEAPSVGTFPQGFPTWLAVFVEEARQENRTLADNGAAQAATARGVLLQRLVAAAAKYLDETVSVVEAAKVTNRHAETIRRAVRKGTLPDNRTNPRGHVRVRRGDLTLLAGSSPTRYDPVADAQDIAQRRRPR